ncbi:DUF2624 domain-containing protein [Scopulibacillus darangshiensis]|nr:DUF2624 domain-containing protein [Scopulibacillus darangshiensis]
MIKQLVNQKINNMTPDELLKVSRQYGLSLSRSQGAKVSGLLKGREVDIFDDHERKALLKTIAKNIDPGLAVSMNKLFNQFI